MNNKINTTKLDRDLAYLADVINTHGLIYEDGACIYDKELVAKYYNSRRTYNDAVARLERAGYIKYQTSEKMGYKTVNLYWVDLQHVKNQNEFKGYFEQDFSDIDAIFDSLDELPERTEKKWVMKNNATQDKDHVIRSNNPRRLDRIPHKTFSRMITPEEYEFGGYDFDENLQEWVKKF